MNRKIADLAQEQGKKKYVREMFNTISGRYDLLDRIISLGIDKSWRRKAVRILGKENPEHILDIATGTADLAITEAILLKPDRIIGVDIAEQMIAIGKQKINQLKLNDIIQLHVGDSENLIFEDNIFDAASVSFGVRNFENLDKGLAEIHRVLKKGGRIMILEFSLPRNKLIKFFYLLYFNYFVPFVGRIVSGNKSAYRYLPGSVNQFPYGKEFIDILGKTGFSELSAKELSLGICTIYSGIK